MTQFLISNLIGLSLLIPGVSLANANVFHATGYGQWGPGENGYSDGYDEAVSDLLDRATHTCTPNKAVPVSNISVMRNGGYGGLRADADFNCQSTTLSLYAFIGATPRGMAAGNPFDVIGIGHELNCHSHFCPPDDSPVYINGKEDAEAKAKRICAPIHANAKRVSDWTLSDPDTAKTQFICEPNNLAGSIVDGHGSIQTFSQDGCTSVDETINARAKAIEDAALQCSHPNDSSRVKLISTWQVWREAYPRGPKGVYGWTCFSEVTAKFECL